MNVLGNIIWLIFGGLAASLSWVVYGLLWCITIVGIPLGKQCFKFARLTLTPFGKDIVYSGGAPSTIANVFWILFTGFIMAAVHFLAGLVCCITIIGIPFGLQYFKLAKLSLLPFGAQIIEK